MIRIVRLYIKTAIVFLLIGLLIGLDMIVKWEIRKVYPDPHTVSAHTHLLLIGFVLMMIMGVALWMFPRPKPGELGASQTLLLWIYGLLVAGVAVRSSAEIILGYAKLPPLSYNVVAGASLEVLAIFIFFIYLWNRIIPKGAAD